MVSNLGIAMAWSSVQTMTIETYPTVVRFEMFVIPIIRFSLVRPTMLQPVVFRFQSSLLNCCHRAVAKTVLVDP